MYNCNESMRSGFESMTSGVARGRPVIFYNRKYSIKTLRILEAKHAV